MEGTGNTTIYGTAVKRQFKQTGNIDFFSIPNFNKMHNIIYDCVFVFNTSTCMIDCLPVVESVEMCIYLCKRLHKAQSKLIQCQN